MKKLSFLLALTLLFSAAFCGAAAFAEEPFGATGGVILEQGGVKLTTAGLDLDPSSGDAEPIIWLDAENTGDRDLWLCISGGVVNGYMSDAYLTRYEFDDEGTLWNTEQTTSLILEAGKAERCALGYHKGVEGTGLETLGTLECVLWLSEDPDGAASFDPASVTIVTGAAVEAKAMNELGTVVLDNDTLTLAIGAQDYDDFFGPEIYVYAENKSDRYLALSAETAEADGVFCDYMFYGAEIAPGKRSASWLSFDGEARTLKGFEKLSLSLSLREADTKEALYSQPAAALAPISVQYPPQNWGEYENGGLRFEIKPKYNDLITVETPENDDWGVLFSVSETASLEAGGFEGAGWLFSIAKIDETRLHALLCRDMSGAYVFAKDAEGGYYLCLHPTDVRYARATTEEMQRDSAQWSMLCAWVDQALDSFSNQNGLDVASFSNTEVDMLLARAAWEKDAVFTLSTTEFGPVDATNVDGSDYVKYALQGWFDDADPKDTPDGEYVVLNFPEENLRLDFFFAPGSYVRLVSGDAEHLYQSILYSDEISIAEAMKGWYYAAAEQAGLKSADESLTAYLGTWTEKLAGRAALTITETLAPGKVKIEASWPESAAVLDTWTMIAVLQEDGSLVYENASFSATEYDENGDGWEIDGDWGLRGSLRLDADGALRWEDARAEGSFVRVG